VVKYSNAGRKPQVRTRQGRTVNRVAAVQRVRETQNLAKKQGLCQQNGKIHTQRREGKANYTM